MRTLLRGAGRLLAAGLAAVITLTMLGVLALTMLLYLTWAAASGKKRLILYLRRFRAESANEALSSAMYHSLRNIGRLVVLDDAVFKPVAIPRRERLILIGVFCHD